MALPPAARQIEDSLKSMLSLSVAGSDQLTSFSQEVTPANAQSELVFHRRAQSPGRKKLPAQQRVYIDGKGKGGKRTKNKQQSIDVTRQNAKGQAVAQKNGIKQIHASPSADSRQRHNMVSAAGTHGEQLGTSAAVLGSKLEAQENRGQQEIPLRSAAQLLPQGSSDQKSSSVQRPAAQVSDAVIGQDIRGSEIESTPILSSERGDRKVKAEAAQHPMAGQRDCVLAYDDESWAAMLADNCIQVVQKKSMRFPNAKYLCDLCDYHMHEKSDVIRHKQLKTHIRKVKAALDDGTLNNMPAPTAAHIAALNEVLERTYHSCVLTHKGVQCRERIMNELKDSLSAKKPGLSLRMYGSCTNGFALAASDVNVALLFPDTVNPAEAMDVLLETLQENTGKYNSVKSNLTARMPNVSFHAEGLPETLFVVEVVNTSKVCACSRFLLECCLVDERVKKLGVLLKLYTKICRMDSQADSMVPAVAFSIMVVYYAQKMTLSPLLPVFHEYLDGAARDAEIISEDNIAKAAEAARHHWKPQNKQTLAELWLGLLRFYAVEFESKTVAVTPTSSAVQLKSDVRWSGKKLAVQDPVCLRQNITRSINNVGAFDYVEDCLADGYRYFAIPQTKAGPAFRVVRPQSGTSPPQQAPTSEPQQAATSGNTAAESNADYTDVQLCKLLQDMDMATMSKEDCFAQRLLSKDKESQGCNASTSGTRRVEARVESTPSSGLYYDRARVELLAAEDMVFHFNGSIAPDEKTLPKFCNTCQQAGHVASDCTDADLPVVEPLPRFTKGLRQVLNKFLQAVLDYTQPTSDDEKRRNDLLQAVQQCVKKKYPDANLTLFGSSNNGFGFSDSDLDICMTFKGQSTIDDLDTAEVIERLAECLRREKGFSSIVPIPTAKVPIVKFYNKIYRLEGDLSLYNTLAQRNTILLRCYSRIDKRVRLLGYGFKMFAKNCDIGDASRGSLSSYSYVLMVIYFLQQCKPPVLPVLQELQCHHSASEDYMVDGYDTYFFDRIDDLASVWPHVGENVKTAGDLWLDMFRFYTEVFDMQNTVICIRQQKLLTRLEKLWNGPTIAIEDPFDREHNLGAALSVKMHTYIMSTFINGRVLYGTPPEVLPTDDELCDYFLDQNVLIGDLVLPNDRGCRLCHKVGHMVRDCPIKLRQKESREKRSKPRKQEGATRRSGEPANAAKQAVTPLLAAAAMPRQVPAVLLLPPGLSAFGGQQQMPVPHALFNTEQLLAMEQQQASVARNASRPATSVTSGTAAQQPRNAAVLLQLQQPHTVLPQGTAPAAKQQPIGPQMQTQQQQPQRQLSQQERDLLQLCSDQMAQLQLQRAQVMRQLSVAPPEQQQVLLLQSVQIQQAQQALFGQYVALQQQFGQPSLLQQFGLTALLPQFSQPSTQQHGTGGAATHNAGERPASVVTAPQHPPAAPAAGGSASSRGLQEMTFTQQHVASMPANVQRQDWPQGSAATSPQNRGSRSVHNSGRLAVTVHNDQYVPPQDMAQLQKK